MTAIVPWFRRQAGMAITGRREIIACNHRQGSGWNAGAARRAALP
jgi:hypothetical protein